MWSTNALTTVTAANGQANIFVNVSHSTFEFTGLHTLALGNRFEKLKPINQSVRQHFGVYTEKDRKRPSVAKSPWPALHGRQFPERVDISEQLGPRSIASRDPRQQPSKRFIRLLKENLLWVKTFATIGEFRQALIAFNHQYKH